MLSCAAVAEGWWSALCTVRPSCCVFDSLSCCVFSLSQPQPVSSILCLPCKISLYLDSDTVFLMEFSMLPIIQINIQIYSYFTLLWWICVYEFQNRFLFTQRTVLLSVIISAFFLLHSVRLKWSCHCLVIFNPMYSCNHDAKMIGFLRFPGMNDFHWPQPWINCISDRWCSS